MRRHADRDAAQRADQVVLRHPAGDLHRHAAVPARPHQRLDLVGVAGRGVTEDAHGRHRPGAAQRGHRAHHLPVALAGIDETEDADHRLRRDGSHHRAAGPTGLAVEARRDRHRQRDDGPAGAGRAPAVHEVVLVPRVGRPRVARAHDPAVGRGAGREDGPVGRLRDVVQRDRQAYAPRELLDHGRRVEGVAAQEPVGQVQVDRRPRHQLGDVADDRCPSSVRHLAGVPRDAVGVGPEQQVVGRGRVGVAEVGGRHEHPPILSRSDRPDLPPKRGDRRAALVQRSPVSRGSLTLSGRARPDNVRKCRSAGDRAEVGAHAQAHRARDTRPSSHTGASGS